jgi:hypothetical protein
MRLEDRLVVYRSISKTSEWWEEWEGPRMENACFNAVGQHLNWGNPWVVTAVKCGSFNACCTVRWMDGRKVIVRTPILGKQILRQEKTVCETATMEYIRRNSSVPVPEILGKGIAPIGPYIIMPWVPGRPLCHLLFSPRDLRLDADVHARDRQSAYREMAEITLRLSLLKFNAIGSLVNNQGNITVATRPLTFTMNELIRTHGLPLAAFPQQPYTTSKAYFEHLAQIHLDHIRMQVSGIIKDETDCRSKLTARFLFLNLVRDHIWFEQPQGPFPLYCDDFRPSNVRADRETNRVTAAIDWEFAYAAPVEFTYAAPWWLMGENPGLWSTNLEAEMRCYKPRLADFLTAMREREEQLISEGVITNAQRLSGRMSASIDNGIFWLCLAARCPGLFDTIYWDYIDQQYYGERSTHDERIQLLSAEQQDELNTLTQRKVAELTPRPRSRPPDPLPYSVLRNM